MVDLEKSQKVMKSWKVMEGQGSKVREGNGWSGKVTENYGRL